MQFRFFERFGKYVFLERLGRGGMAEVYLAIAPGASGVNKFYAIKKIVSDKLEQRSYVAMFKEEAQIAIQLQHNNIVSVHDFGFENAQFFLVMEYVQGHNLAAFLKLVKQKRKILPLPIVAFLIQEITAGLEYAHNAVALGTGLPLNIVHRDINPHNVMIGYSGDVKIIDFGVARASGEFSEAPRQGSGLVGKVHYMSPEIVGGREIDFRSDQFSLGVLFWELVTGKKLFEGDTEAGILANIRKGRIPDIKRQNPFVTDELEAIILRCLEPHPEERYQNTSDLLRATSFLLTNNYPDTSKKNLRDFFKNLIGDEDEEAKSRLRTYYNMHFGDATGNAALAVPRASLPVRQKKGLHGHQDSTPREDFLSETLSPSRERENPEGLEETQFPEESKDGESSQEQVLPAPPHRPGASISPQLPKSLGERSLNRSMNPDYSHPTGVSQSTGLSQVTGLSQIPSIHRKPSPQDKVAFSKALYTGTQYTQESLNHQQQKMRFIYGFLAAAILFSVVFYFQSQNHSQQVQAKREGPRGGGFVYEVGSVKAMVARDQQGCILNPLGLMSCWGRNDFGQLGNGSSSPFESFGEVSRKYQFDNVSLGSTHACGVTQMQVNGLLRKPLKCWGDNHEGQVGDPTATQSFVAVTVDPGVDYLETSVGDHHSCGLTASKQVKCWGQGRFGQLGDTRQPKSLKPVLVVLPELISQISSGADHVCAVTETGRAYCWGRNDLGQTGTGQSAPAMIRSSSVFVALASGEHHTCGLTLPGAVECWGKNEYGQLGTGSAEPTPYPSPVKNSLVFTQLTAGYAHTCGLDVNRDLWCWGKNDRGQISGAAPKSLWEPTKVAPAFGVTKMALGDGFTCWSQGVNISCLGEAKLYENRRPAQSKGPNL